MAPGPVTTRPRHRPARWTDPGSLRLRASGSSTWPASVSATRMTVPVKQGSPEIAFQGLDHAGDLSELHAAARPGSRGPGGKVATATNLGGLGLGALVAGSLARRAGRRQQGQRLDPAETVRCAACSPRPARLPARRPSRRPGSVTVLSGRPAGCGLAARRPARRRDSRRGAGRWRRRVRRSRPRSGAARLSAGWPRAGPASGRPGSSS